MKVTAIHVHDYPQIAEDLRDAHLLQPAAYLGIHTENSHKYTLEGFRQLAEEGGFGTERTWTDPERLFSVHLLRAH